MSEVPLQDYTFLVAPARGFMINAGLALAARAASMQS